MLFFKPTEIDRMREELMDHCNKSYMDSCLQHFDDFSETVLASIKNDEHLDDEFFSQTTAESDRMLADAQRQINNIANMSDGDVKQLYYRTFNRWHPVS